MLKILVGVEGNPLSITYNQKATHASNALIASAIRAAAQWRFNPGMKDGQPYSEWIELPVTFQLNPYK